MNGKHFWKVVHNKLYILQTCNLAVLYYSLIQYGCHLPSDSYRVQSNSFKQPIIMSICMNLNKIDRPFQDKVWVIPSFGCAHQ